MATFAEKYINPFTDEKLFEVAEIAKFSPEEVNAYEDSLKIYRDLKNSMDTAREEGEVIGIEKVAIGLIKQNVSDEIILVSTGLSFQQLDDLKFKVNAKE